MQTKQVTFKLYKIYSENGLLYIGKTNQPLKTKLWTHFFKTPMVREINIEAVTKIEYAVLPTAADMNLMESYYINQLKPILNREGKAKDDLTISLPELKFKMYKCHLLEKWRQEIQKTDAFDVEKRRIKQQLEEEKQAKHSEIFHQEGLPLEDKRAQWYQWLEQYYEPARNSLL